MKDFQYIHIEHSFTSVL